MAASSLICFGLVFICVSALASLLLGGVLKLAESNLRTLGHFTERRGATLVLLLPPLLGLTVTAILAGNSALALASGTDHCLEHGHHLHLCLKHSALWASEPWAVVTLCFFATFIIIRAIHTAWAHLYAQLAATRLKDIGSPIDDFDHGFLVPGEEKTAFTTGVFSPTIIISRGAWNALDVNGRAALMAHEQAHITHGDLGKRAALGVLACLGVPMFTRRALEIWELASERICDRDAASRVGRSSIVAGAILSLSQLPGKRPATAVAVFAAASNVTQRVHSLLNHEPGGEPVARSLAGFSIAATVLAAAACMIFAESLHHILETILG
ncbi:MAG: M48 family metalloprotease [Deltaproteobacteria bacterium]|nr:M48 family metalloprotease [Deltaproteobacteria bacterium]